jgi:hypothetical protein
MQRGVQTPSKLDLCCQMRLVDDPHTKKQMMMCRNVAHSDKHDHCNPKRMFVVKRSTIPRSEKESSKSILL